MLRFLAQYPWKDLLAPANIPNWLLVIVGIVASAAAIKTLQKVKRQADLMNRQNVVAITAAKAAQDSAIAALQQTNHMIASERAWLVIASVNDHLTFVWSGGRTLVLVASEKRGQYSGNPYRHRGGLSSGEGVDSRRNSAVSIAGNFEQSGAGSGGLD